jgi:hypothetical protein
MRNLIYISIVSFLLMSCGDSEHIRLAGEPSVGAPGGSGQPGGDTNTGTGGGNKTRLDFARVKTEILDNYCINCHTGQHVLYAQYNVVRIDALNMLREMDARTMPQAGAPQLSQAQIELFRAWVNAGTPEFDNSVDDEPNDGSGGDDDTGGDDGGGDTSPDPSLLGFAEIKEKVLKPFNCTACHTQYNDYLPVYKDRVAILQAVTSNWMPFKRTQRPNEVVKPVDDKGKKLLTDWIVEQGAPEMAGAEPPVTVDVEIEPNWISLRNNVFGPKCILCHNSFGPRGGGRNQAFGTYTELRNWFTRRPTLFVLGATPEEEPGDLIATFDPSASTLSEMPFNNEFDDLQNDVEKITPDELAVIRRWLELNLPFTEG